MSLPNRQSIRLPNYDYSSPEYYFVTICTHDMKFYFGKIADAKIILSEIGLIAQQCWLEIPAHYPSVRLDEFIVMPNHLHGIIIINDNPELTANRRVLILEILNMSSNYSYNRVLEALASLTSLLVNLLKYAQRHPKDTSFRRRFESDALWRHGPFSTVLSKIGFEAISAKLHSLGTPQQSISSSSTDSDYDLYDDRWNEAYFGHQDFALQWILPSPAGVERLPGQFDPKKPGRPSYHPLLCFEGRTRTLWHGILRPGDTHATTGVEAFFKECLDKIPPYLYRIRLRADAGFFDHVLIEMLDEAKIGYVIVGRMTRPIQEKIQTLRYRTFRQDGWQAASFTYQPHNFKTPQRFIVVRRPQNQDKDEQPTLFKLKDYFYHLFITNLHLPAPGIWHFYRKRARAELDIRELKESFPLGKIPSNSFLANQAHFHLILLAYDLVQWFKHLCLPLRWKSSTLQTIRTELLVLPARLVYSGGVNELKIPPGYIHHKLFDQALKNIERLKIHKNG